MKSEKAKMLAGEHYNPMDEVLSKSRMKTRKILFKFNRTKPKNLKQRKTLIRKLLPSIGKNFTFEPPFYCDYGWNIAIGENFFANYNCIILDVNKVSIGNNCLFAPGVVQAVDGAASLVGPMLDIVAEYAVGLA